MSVAVTAARATLADLAQVDGKAELVGGRVVPILPTSHRPGTIALRIARRLTDHADTAGGVE